MHGPAELLPISSSGHVTVIPWLLRWDYAELDPELRKAFEVVLHAGTAAALLITLRPEVAEAARGLSPRLVWFLGLSFAPPAIVGYVLERRIERHLGTPATIAHGATSWVTTAPAPITTPAPTVMPSNSVAPAPIHTSSPTCTPRRSSA